MSDSPAIDKSKLVAAIVASIEKEIAQIKVGFEEARLTSIEAPGRMQSRYDTMAVEAAWVASGLSKTIAEKASAMHALRHMELPTSPKRVRLGCVVGVGPEGGEVAALYFIVPGGGGMSLPVDGTALTVQTVTAGAPSSRALISKELGDEVEIRKNTDEPDTILLLV
jgi:hypothetical protein